MKSMMKRKGCTAKGRAKVFERMCSTGNNLAWPKHKTGPMRTHTLEKKIGEGVPVFGKNQGRVMGKKGEGAKKDSTRITPKLPANLFFTLVA